MADEAAKVLGLSQLLPSAYQDLLQPAAREAGQQLIVVAEAVRIALEPLHLAVWGYDQIRDFLLAKVAAKLARQPTNEIVAPDPTVAGPVIMNMVFAANAPHLREMYANLLASAMHAPSAAAAHPSFSYIIQQINAAEARILHDIGNRYAAGETIFSESEKRGMPIRGSQLIFIQWRELCERCGVADVELADASRGNLIRLGLLAEDSETTAKYLEEGGDRHGTWGPDVETTTSRCLFLTDYGDAFCEVCVRELTPPAPDGHD